MPCYAAFLRGVSPMNAKMPDLKKCFERAGFSDVKPLLSSGNVLFSARAAPLPSLERKAEAAMSEGLGKAFLTIVRPVEALREILRRDPYRSFRVAPGAKRVVTFLRERAGSRIALPIELDGARVLCREGGEVFSAYVPGPRGPVFMRLIEKTFGATVTTRTLGHSQEGRWMIPPRPGSVVSSRCAWYPRPLRGPQEPLLEWLSRPSLSGGR